jgi:hypothetical protein
VKHLARILAVVVPVLVAALTSALKTPTVTNYLEQHPLAAGYVVVLAGLGHAAWKAYTDRRNGRNVPAPPSGGPGMAAK